MVLVLSLKAVALAQLIYLLSAASGRSHISTETDVNELLLQLLTSQPDTSQQENHRASCRSSYI